MTAGYALALGLIRAVRYLVYTPAAHELVAQSCHPGIALGVLVALTVKCGASDAATLNESNPWTWKRPAFRCGTNGLPPLPTAERPAT